MTKTGKKTVNVKSHKRAKPGNKNKTVKVKHHHRTPPD